MLQDASTAFLLGLDFSAAEHSLTAQKLSKYRPWVALSALHFSRRNLSQNRCFTVYTLAEHLPGARQPRWRS